MRIVIVGLGGIGGLVGGRLLAGGLGVSRHDITFWCRGKTQDVIRNKGLTLTDEKHILTVRPDLATCSADEFAAVGAARKTGLKADLIIFATKNYHLDAAAQEVCPLASENTVILPLLNGVSAASVLQKHIPQSDVLGGCIYASAYVKSPGEVRQVGAMQRVVFGKKGISKEDNKARYGAIEKVLKQNGIDITLTERIDVEMWSKFAFISPFAGVTTLYGRTIGEILADPGTFETVSDMVGELESLARAKNIDLPKDIAGVTIEKARAFAPQTKTSMQVDQENGRQTELESLIGYVCREGEALGLSLPAYKTVYDGLKK